jgi:hypothetical protein
MGRVINTNNPGKERNYNRRTIAELLRHLSKKTTIDKEAQDMLATIVYALRAIDDGIVVSAEAWEKRGYWMKAERFMRDWQWVKEAAYNLEDVLRFEAWDLAPRLILDLYPQFDDIQVKSLTRKAITWTNNYAKLMAEPASDPPY